MAASEMAQRIKKTVDDEGYYDMEAASEAVDRLVLQEVREIVELIAHPKFKIDGDGVIVYYVTKSDVAAARDLLAKLIVPAETV